LKVKIKNIQDGIGDVSNSLSEIKQDNRALKNEFKVEM